MLTLLFVKYYEVVSLKQSRINTGLYKKWLALGLKIVKLSLLEGYIPGHIGYKE